MTLALPHTDQATKANLSPSEQLRLFRNLIRSLSDDAAKAVAELEMWCSDANQLERCQLLRHYLTYMKRLCEGTA
jgi:hypothetical protein